MRRPRRLSRAWPGGLIGRVMLVLLAAVVLESAAGAVVYEQFELHRADDARATLVSDRLTVARRVISAAPAARRPELAEAFSTPDLRVAWSPARDGLAGAPARFGIAKRLRELTDAGGGALQLAVERGDGLRAVVGALDTDGGGSLRFRLPSVPDERAFVARGVLSAAVTAVLVLAAALMLIHVLTTPLRHLTAVVEASEAGDSVLVEEGPKDVRDLARAFNGMQARIAGMVADRTRSLAAISHDLRTPLARIRLRAGFMPDAEMRAAVETDVSEMEAMIDTVLAYVRGETDTDPPELVHLGSLLLTVAEEAQDLGADVAYEGPAHLTATLRRMGMKRAVTNLLDNARRYAASSIRLRLAASPGELRIMVEDDGPGIPEDALPRITEPFFRIEADRSRESGGAGLGLPIVRTAVEREGGRLEIANRPEGGLRCEIVLPRG